MTGLVQARALAGQLAARIGDQRVLDAIASTPREAFVPGPLRDRAYDNEALPIAGGQTISQPLVVARMLELLALTGDELVLDVGTGSGYHAALLALLAREVISIEVVGDLHDAAVTTLTGLGRGNVTCLLADGWDGFPGRAPYDAINVAAASGREPPPRLLEQLAPGGRMVAPIGRRHQYLTVYRRGQDGRLRSTTLDSVRFVPLVHPRPRTERPGRGDRA
ncbi:MAG: protein-L-isoaspartate(D-aspartate) O-methyltransferase [Solirubrobacteraceae bacterium]